MGAIKKAMYEYDMVAPWVKGGSHRISTGDDDLIDKETRKLYPVIRAKYGVPGSLIGLNDDYGHEAVLDVLDTLIEAGR